MTVHNFLGNVVQPKEPLLGNHSYLHVTPLFVPARSIKLYLANTGCFQGLSYCTIQEVIQKSLRGRERRLTKMLLSDLLEKMSRNEIF